MKKIVVFLCAVFTFLLVGCSPTNQYQVIDKPASITLPEIEDSDTNNDSTKEQKKKTYVVGKANGLRIRSLASSSAKTVGYLDKNDAIQYVGTEGDYYKTIYKEQPGYVHSSYCNLMEIEYESEQVEKAIDIGSSLLGYPYVWGSQRYHWGNGKLNSNFVNGEFDCSALVQYVYYKSNGVLLDVTSRSQVNNGLYVAKSNLKRGDLMFFTNASRKDKTGNERIGHVGIYFGNNYILHTASDHAVIEPISETRWSYYITARRVV